MDFLRQILEVVVVAKIYSEHYAGASQVNEAHPILADRRMDVELANRKGRSPSGIRNARN
jgi:hypothetical protein